MPELKTATDKQEKILSFSAGILITIIFISLASGVAGLFAAQIFFVIPPAYPDFLVGATTWEAASKFQDIVSYPLFLLGALLGAWSAYRFFLQLSHKDNEYVRSLQVAILWWFVPVAIGIGESLRNYSTDYAFPLIVGVLGLSASIVGVRLTMNRLDVSPKLIGLGILGCMLISLVPFAISAVQDRFLVGLDLPRFSVAPKVGVFVFLGSTLFLFYLGHCMQQSLKLYIERILVAGQIGLSAFYCLLLPDLYLSGTTKLAMEASPWLYVLSGTLILISIRDVLVRRTILQVGIDTNLNCLLSPLAVFTTVILFRYGQTAAPHIPTDDYHFGESLLGWWSLFEFGKLPYINFFPSHGVFVDDFGGYLSLLFYDGSASNIIEADRLGMIITLFVAFLALNHRLSSLGLTYVAILLFGFASRKLTFIFFVPIMCAWFAPRLSAHARQWLWMWLLMAPLSIIAVPPQGVLVVLASLPAVAFHAYRASWRNWKLDISGIVAIIAALAIFTPFFTMLYGAVSYVLANGQINQIIYGIPWSWSRNSNDWGKAILLDAIRMSWVCIPLIAAVLLIWLFRRRERLDHVVCVVLPGLLFLSLLSPYAMGRIDPGTVSRPGIVGIFAFAILLPLLLRPWLTEWSKAVLAISIAAFCASIGLNDLNREGMHSVLVKNQLDNLWSGSQHGLNNIGTATVDHQHTDRLVRINNFLSAHLPTRETYLDLTGHNAHYMYFDREPAMAITAPYNLAPITQQKQAITRLRVNPPKIALIEAENINFDGGGLALRSHFLYRFVIHSYAAELHDGYIYGTRTTGDIQRNAISFGARDFSDINWLHGIHRNEPAIIIRDTKTVRFLRIGDSICLPNGELRKIMRIWAEGNVIWVDGGRIEVNPADPKLIELVTNTQRKKIISEQLMGLAFTVPDLRKLPVAWGLSLDSLSSLMKPIFVFDTATAKLHDLTKTENGYRVSGTDPYLWMNTSENNINGQLAGLLKLNFVCHGSPNPRIKIFWWGDEMQWAEPEKSMIFTAESGSLIVPLDAYPSWLNLKKVNGLRIDIDSENACETFELRNVSLHQRTNL